MSVLTILVFPLKAILIGLDFMVMLLTFQWIWAIKKALEPEPLRSVAVGDNPSHRVKATHPHRRLTSIYDNVDTLHMLQLRAFTLYAHKRCMGTRVYFGQLNPKVKKFGDVIWRTFEDVGKDSHRFGAALRASGLVAAPRQTTLDKLSDPCSLALYENTCAEWMVAAMGCFTQSMAITTIYATLGIQAVVDAINDGVIAAMLCNKRSVSEVVSHAKNMPTLKTIIYTSDMIGPDEDIKLPSTTNDMRIISFEDFVKSGDMEKYQPVKPSPNTTAVIMYTSGSTGKPKGVIATHSNILAAVASGQDLIGIKEGGEVYLGYLPLAHILELMAEIAMIGLGNTICYADPRTLTATGASPIGALEQYSPTLMAGVPKIWDLIKKGVQAKISKSPKVAQFLIHTAFQAKSTAMKYGYDTPLFNLLVFRKFSKVVGGKMREALSGGGPLNSEVQEFVRTCFGFPLFQGYGLTETCAVLAIQDPKDLRSGIAGVPGPSVEVKLESTPDITDKGGLPYLSSDTRDVEGNHVFGRGEILVKGPSVVIGYYMMSDKTKEEFTSDGFFHTGDIGQFMSDGSLRIVDRKKNLLKLKGGEYIAIENMEMTYGNSVFVDAASGGICCYGDGDMDRPVALIQLSKPAAMDWAAKNGRNADFDSLIKLKELHDAVLYDMKNEAKKGGLSHLENLVAVGFVTEPWTPENGGLTAANKLNRRVVVEMHEKQFNEVRAKGIFH